MITRKNQLLKNQL